MPVQQQALFDNWLFLSCVLVTNFGYRSQIIFMSVSGYEKS